mgnify:CR=1 FL=1
MSVHCAVRRQMSLGTMERGYINYTGDLEIKPASWYRFSETFLLKSLNDLHLRTNLMYNDIEGKCGIGITLEEGPSSLFVSVE